MKIRHLIVFVMSCCFVWPAAYAQQFTIEGQVIVHNSKSVSGALQYVGGVTISASFSAPVVTDDQGQFVLIFAAVDAGTKLAITVEKADWEVVNKRDIQQVFIGRRVPLRIYMTPSGQMAQKLTEIYNIASQAIENRYQAMLSRLTGEDQVAAMDELEATFGRTFENLYEAIDALNDRKAAVKKTLPDMSRRMAEINLDFASRTSRQAYQYFLDGELDNAIEILDNSTIEDEFLRIQAMKSDLEKEQAKIKQEIAQITESYQLKAKLYKLSYQYQEAKETYLKVVRLLESVSEKDDVALADAYADMGNICWDLGDYTNALNYQEKNMSILVGRLEETGFTLPSISSSFQSIANASIASGEYDKVMAAHLKMISILEEMQAQNETELAASYRNLASLYWSFKEYDKAVQAQQKTIAIMEREMATDKQHLYLATSYHNLALIHEAMGQQENARTARQTAYSIHKQSGSAFPWPPPRASASYVFQRDMFAKAKKLREVEQKLNDALEQCGYFERSFYCICPDDAPRGFALVARMEQTDQKAYPLNPPDRWEVDVQSMQGLSMERILNLLFGKNPGYFRIIVFLVTDQAFEQSDQSISREEGMRLLNRGMNILPSTLGEMAVTENYRCTALIYDFELAESGNSAQLRMPSPFQGKVHLERSQLIRVLSE